MLEIDLLKMKNFVKVFGKSLKRRSSRLGHTARRLPAYRFSCEDGVSSVKTFATLRSHCSIRYSRHGLGASGRRYFSADSKDNLDGTETTTEDKVENEDDDAKSNADGDSENNEQLQKIADLEEEVKDLKDKYMRSLAEVDNVRNIAKRDVQNATTYASQKLQRHCSIRRTTQLGFRDDQLEDNEVLSKFHEGVVMTENNLQNFLNNGIVKFGEVGDEFDPAIHEAMFQIPDPDAAPNTIGQMVSVGYMFKDCVLRPAQAGTYTGN